MRLPVVFLHGWGQSGQIWQRQRDVFPDATFLNLPGHGGTPDASDWIKAIAGQLPESPCIIIGWSLGGMIAMQLAIKFPEKVAALALVSTTPCFCMKNGWKHGCSNELLQTFKSGIETNAEKTMRRFFALMFQGDGISRQACNDIARIAFDRANPATEAGLRRGLEQLEQLDLRRQLSQIMQPALVMHGEKDAVVPCRAGRQLARSLPNSSWHPIMHCGHAPFLSQTEIFNEALEAWCHTI
ncbi:MAG: alpha/beta fold hydrolase [Mariprofundaceae bacterium]|nr:alpha/beta fold hydrolase [Mariprofundaceae bacterium]